MIDWQDTLNMDREIILTSIFHIQTVKIPLALLRLLYVQYKSRIELFLPNQNWFTITLDIIVQKDGDWLSHMKDAAGEPLTQVLQVLYIIARVKDAGGPVRRMPVSRGWSPRCEA